MTTPAGAFSYTYDGDGRMTGLTNPYGEASSWNYLDNGWLHTQALGNGATATYAYNPLGQLSSLTNRTAGGVGLSDFGSMAYDGAGNRTAVTANLPTAPSAYSGTTAYGYDAKDQLTQEQSTRLNGYANGFGYDAAGNATTFRGASRSFNSDNQHTANAYDGDGNPTVYGGNTLACDPESRMTAYGSALTAGYTGEGLRAWKQNSGGRTYFLYDGETPVCELDASGAVTAVNTTGTAGLLSRRSGGASVFYTFDLSGNVAQRLNAAGNVASSDTYDAFGGRVSTSSTADVFGYGAKYSYQTDAETGLVLCTHRYYDTQIGRWLTRDPMGYGGGVNLYGYTQNNPVNWSDPEGLKPGQKYRSPDAAGKAGIIDINPKSVRVNREYQGLIYHFPEGGYSYTPPVQSGPSNGKNNLAYPGDTTVCGHYHTHAAYDPHYDNEHFSPVDKDTLDGLRIPGYLGTPGGRILKYQPLPGKSRGGTTTPIGRAPTK